MNKKMSITSFSKNFLLILSIALLTTSVSISQNNTRINIPIEVAINSVNLNEERIVSIFLPNNYELNTQKYPVLYLLDGRGNFRHATGAVNFLSGRGIIPEMIVVTIHNIDRSRDFSPVYDARIPTSGGSEKFLNFVSDELIKYVDSNYRSADFTIIFGHSFGGTFATYSLLTKPEVFDAYIAISPYLHYADNYLVKEAVNGLRSAYDKHKYFYMTVGDEPQYFLPLAEFSSLIKEKSAEAIDFEYRIMKSENHATIPYISIFNGLRFIFSDWQLTRPKFELGLSAIDEHYKKVSAIYDLKIKTPENVINNLGYTYLRNKDFENAIKVFTENVKRFPKSPNVYDSLGEAYEKNNQLKLAKKNYQKAVDLGKNQQDANMAIYQKNLNRVQ